MARAQQLKDRWVVPARHDLGPIREAIRTFDADLEGFLGRYFLPAPDVAWVGQFSVTSGGQPPVAPE
jgi:hypothetical protein